MVTASQLKMERKDRGVGSLEQKNKGEWRRLQPPVRGGTVGFCCTLGAGTADAWNLERVWPLFDGWSPLWPLSIPRRSRQFEACLEPVWSQRVEPVANHGASSGYSISLATVGQCQSCDIVRSDRLVINRCEAPTSTICLQTIAELLEKALERRQLVQPSSVSD